MILTSLHSEIDSLSRLQPKLIARGGSSTLLAARGSNWHRSVSCVSTAIISRGQFRQSSGSLTVTSEQEGRQRSDGADAESSHCGDQPDSVLSVPSTNAVSLIFPLWLVFLLPSSRLIKRVRGSTECIEDETISKKKPVGTLFSLVSCEIVYDSTTGSMQSLKVH